MYRKYLSVVVILLFLLSSLIPMVSSDTTTLNNTIYVDDDNIEGPWYGTELYPYQYVQDAVNNASDWDEIIVKNGSYIQNFVVDKPLLIHSEHGYNNCKLEASTYRGSVIKIINDSVIIRGFTIKGGSDLSIDNAINLQYVNNCSIFDNYIHSSSNGITVINSNNNSFYGNLLGRFWSYENLGFILVSSNHNKIFNNTLEHLGTNDIELRNSTFNIITNNIIKDGIWGINLKSSSDNNYIFNNIVRKVNYFIKISSSNHNIIDKNNISNIHDGIAVDLEDSNYTTLKNLVLSNNGITFHNSYHNTIENVTINDKPIIYLEDESDKIIDEISGQIFLINCNNITVRNQNISDVINAIILWNTSNTKIYNNKISSKHWDSAGLKVKFGSNNSIYHNSIFQNEIGISISSSDGNLIYSNIFYDNGESLHGGLSVSRSENNYIYNNTFRNNQYGITFGKAYNNTIFNNEIYDNIYGIWLWEKCDCNIIKYNYFHDNDLSISFYQDDNNTIKYNNFENDSCGIYLLDSYSNKINYNNFIQSPFKFDLSYIYDNIFNPNNINYNYWGEPLSNPKPIKGRGFAFYFYVGPLGVPVSIPILKYIFDWHPAQEPYDIPEVI